LILKFKEEKMKNKTGNIYVFNREGDQIALERAIGANPFSLFIAFYSGSQKVFYPFPETPRINFIPEEERDLGRALDVAVRDICTSLNTGRNKNEGRFN
jgi:hypothetical protein